MSGPIIFWVRPAYHGDELLIEFRGDHREAGFPNVAEILRDALRSSKVPHPKGLDDRHIALVHDRAISFWTYDGGNYEIDDDTWGLFVSAPDNKKSVIADIERALISTGRFAKEAVDFDQFR